MKKRRIFNWLFVSFFVLSGTINCMAWAAKEDLPKGSTMPAFTLPAPDSTEMKTYLGIDDRASFTISQIPSKMIIIEFFSVICPVCHRQAPRANSIFNFIANDEHLKKDIKMLGVGLGDKIDQLPVYARSFNVTFPLFADPEKVIQKKIAVENIPLTVVIDKNGKVLFSHLGVIKDLDKFFSELRTLHRNQ